VYNDLPLPEQQTALELWLSNPVTRHFIHDRIRENTKESDQIIDIVPASFFDFANREQTIGERRAFRDILDAVVVELKSVKEQLTPPKEDKENETTYDDPTQP